MDTAAKGLGRCGICGANIAGFTAVDSVLLGQPPKAYVCHRDCKKGLAVSDRVKESIHRGEREIAEKGIENLATLDELVDDNGGLIHEPPGVISNVEPDPPMGEQSDYVTVVSPETLAKMLDDEPDAYQLPSMPHREQAPRKRGRPRKETS